MATFEHTFTASLEAVHAAAAELSGRADTARSLDDASLLAAQASLASATRQLDATASLLAGEVLARSAVAAGHDGLAQRTGFRTPEALVKHLTGSTAREASTLLRVGSLLNDSAVAERAARHSEPDGSVGSDGSDAGMSTGLGASASMREPWLVGLGRAVTSGTISVAGAEAIRNGIGTPTEQITAEALGHVVRELIERVDVALKAAQTIASAGGVAPSLDPESLFRWARDARDELDAEGIRDRERAQREARTLRRWRKPDGMTRYTWELEPENAALIDDIYDQLTSPRRGGPRFTRDADKERAEAILRDGRTTEQLASDGFLELLRIGANTAPTEVIGSRRPAVRVLVTDRALRDRAGHGRIEGHSAPISIETVERHLCDSGTVEIAFDESNQPVDVGREQRLFTGRQRIALAARDGGCMAPGCERPPSWTEAHHIKHWLRDRGRTDLDNGILLCRHHHLLFHDHGWEITRRDGEFWLTPPASVDPRRTPQRMPSKSPALRDLQRSRGHSHGRGRGRGHSGDRGMKSAAQASA